MTRYEEAVNWLYTQLPMYQRIGAAAYKADLNNTIKLCGHFNDPQNHFKSIHIAGTNGKGSTSHMLASILQHSGYKVGLYTSPHLKSFTERIRINGKEIKEQFVTDFVNENKDFFMSFDPSFFEITVAMAFEYFRKEKVDIAVIETGLGGRLDSTNIITPILSVITNIGLDHQNLLGNTLEKIAFEKAGIIKKNVPIVIGQFQEEIADVFIDRANELDAPLMFADNRYSLEKPDSIQTNYITHQTFSYRGKDSVIQIETDQLGIYQRKNCKTVLTVVDELKRLGFNKIDRSSVSTGFKTVSSTTGLKGRWQILNTSPLTIADTGHNIDGMRSNISQLGSLGKDQLRMVIGFVNDKSIEEILQILPRNAVYYFTQASIPRAMPANEVFDLASKHHLKGQYFETTAGALRQAELDAMSNDIIFIGGSTFVVAELI
jgi:dihydrofolate synthase/folylpolyglutamate synthase